MIRLVRLLQLRALVGPRNREKLSRFLAVHKLFWRARKDSSPEARGRHLLRAWLTPEQRRQLDTRGCFDVIGCDTGRKYRIHFGVSANVQELDEDGRPRMGWCFAPAGDLVHGDVMLAQKIALETDEQTVLAVANPFPATPPSVRRHMDRLF